MQDGAPIHGVRVEDDAAFPDGRMETLFSSPPAAPSKKPTQCPSGEMNGDRMLVMPVRLNS